MHEHELKSTLHEKNLRDEQAVSKANERLKQRGLPAATTSPASKNHIHRLSDDTDLFADHDGGKEFQFRDRAAERRQAFTRPALSEQQPQQQSSRVDRPRLPADDDPEPGMHRPNKGASLLAKVAGAEGYAEGKGLGSSGNEGRTGLVEQGLYATGVGLGAEGGRLGDAVEVADKKTTGESVGTGRGKGKARERWERM